MPTLKRMRSQPHTFRWPSVRGLRSGRPKGDNLAPFVLTQPSRERLDKGTDLAGGFCQHCLLWPGGFNCYWWGVEVGVWGGGFVFNSKICENGGFIRAGTIDGPPLKFQMLH